HRVERVRLGPQLALAICLAPGKQQRHRNVMPTRGRRSHPGTSEAFLDDPQLLFSAEPPAPASIDNLEPLDTASICKDIHTDSLLSDCPLKPRRPSAEAYETGMLPCYAMARH